MSDKIRTILAIESSCDETAAAVIRNGTEVLSSVVSSQIPLHARFGGVVPEVAARAHVEQILPVIEQAILEAFGDGDVRDLIKQHVDAIAVTTHPGLIGSLLVGVNSAKALAFALNKPLIPVNHLFGHIFSPYLSKNTEILYPTVSLVVSGGHTALYLTSAEEIKMISQTRDDAAGEAFDKAAALLNLPYPGGPSISIAATKGDYTKYRLPRGLSQKSELDFSFSGLKTALADLMKKLEKSGVDLGKEQSNLAASFQDSVVDSLVTKTIFAASKYQAKRIALCGGVAANSELRNRHQQKANEINLELVMPEMQFCTDNAAMIGAAAYRLSLAETRFNWYNVDVERNK
ncbi:MAG: tRNA (adenosine(37)-N6)-threonylcarbamoyltransferase complex transferase subunit TsaD [Patescibacteria group bacterium]|jgi:N6-L-threonylcarbamoyladenine synthase